MNKKILFALWGVLFILCAGLGFIPEPQGALKGAMTALSVVFFLPGAILLARAKKERDIPTLKTIRSLSIASLTLTAVVLSINFLTFMGSAALGDALYAVLVIVSSPMVCSGYWILSLFLWACLLVVSFNALRKKK